jgi:hypothetical protein
MIPGPSALVMAGVLSGLPLHSFIFRGFPPRKSGAANGFWPSMRPRRTRSSFTKAHTACSPPCKTPRPMATGAPPWPTI